MWKSQRFNYKEKIIVVISDLKLGVYHENEKLILHSNLPQAKKGDGVRRDIKAILSRETLGYTVSQVVAQFKDVVEGEGMLMGKLHLHVDQCVPAVQLPGRKPPVALKEKYQAELERLVEKGIIVRVSEPTDWISSTVVVMKPNGKIRLCLDPRPLNKALKRNHYPMPVIDDLLPDLCKACC